MRMFATAVAALALAASVSASETKTYTGVVSDSMCARDHAAMKIEPQDKCVRDCVGHAKDVKYVLLHDGHAMILSNQETPARFAGRRVTVTGVYYAKTNVLKVERIAPAR
ncbi:MAG TPA: DUF5818 domain-containing protein [Vicinamibacterales bacterium]|nr:DUF5818 domain-containing protein [Vicinamibacterales bacterium]